MSFTYLKLCCNCKLVGVCTPWPTRFKVPMMKEFLGSGHSWKMSSKLPACYKLSSMMTFNSSSEDILFKKSFKSGTLFLWTQKLATDFFVLLTMKFAILIAINVLPAPLGPLKIILLFSSSSDRYLWIIVLGVRVSNARASICKKKSY